MNISSGRWITLGGALVIGFALLGCWLMRHDDAAPISPPPAAVTAAPANAQPVAAVEATSNVALPEREATHEITPLSPRGLAVHGRVYDEDTLLPIADASIGVYGGSDDAPTTRSATTATDGTFVVEDVDPGYITLGVLAPGYANKHVQAVARNDAAPVEIGLVAGGSIAGILVAPDGTTPITGHVWVSDLDRHSGSGSSTSPGGEFEFHQLAPGRYRLKGQTKEGGATREIVLGKGEHKHGIVLALAAGRSVRVVITGLRADEMAGTGIYWNREGYGSGQRAPADTRIDDSGAFVIRGVPPGRVYMSVEVNGRRQMRKTLNMPADSDLTVRFDFPRGVRLSGRITHGGLPLRDVPVAPVPPRGTQPIVDLYSALTSSEGSYVIEDVPAGKYMLMIDGFQAGPVDVSGDTVFDFDVPGGQLTGRVLETGGEPMMGAAVYAWPVEGNAVQRPMWSASDDLGKFTVDGLEPGEFTLTVYKRGYEMHRKRISFEASSTELTIQLREEPGVEVTAYVASEDSPFTLTWMSVAEEIGSGKGVLLSLRLDGEGKSVLPRALAGSTLTFTAPGCEPTTVDTWNGSKLDLQFERAR
jgi:hypothetical protein